MRRIRIARGAPYQPMSRQHKRTLVWLVIGTLTFGAYYLWSARPIDPLAVPFESHETYMNNGGAEDTLKPLQSYDWKQAPFINKIESYIPLPTGAPRKLPTIQHDFSSESRSQRQKREARRVVVRKEFERVWESYRKFAFGQDELKPVTGEAQESFGGWGATLVDSLDTLWIMGLKEEFKEAVEAVVAIDFGKSGTKTISVFETTIRYLGGLLSAYDLSKEPALLEKAIQLGEMLYRAFDTTNNTPLNYLDIEKTKMLDRQEADAEYNICFACIGSLTMEFTRLAQITSQPKYYDVVAKITAMFDRTQSSTKLPGLWPTMVNAAKENFNTSSFFSIGALADSTYEYFPKMHALLGGLDPAYEKLYRGSAKMIDKYMLFRPRIPQEELGEDLLVCGDVYATQSDSTHLNPEGQHLTCFIGGMFGIAGRLFEDKHHVDLGAKLTKGCIYTYSSMPSGIMPETFAMLPCKSRLDCPWNQTAWEQAACGNSFDPAATPQSSKNMCGMPPGFTSINDKRYLLRPEAIESVFIMYRITGDETYLDAAWNMFMSIVKASRTSYANGQVYDVTIASSSSQLRQQVLGSGNGDSSRNNNIEDKMESFWTAETLKYFYLIFSPPDMISLDDWVFNTEAHPFRRPKSTETKSGP